MKKINDELFIKVYRQTRKKRNRNEIDVKS